MLILSKNGIWASFMTHYSQGTAEPCMKWFLFVAIQQRSTNHTFYLFALTGNIVRALKLYLWQHSRNFFGVRFCQDGNLSKAACGKRRDKNPHQLRVFCCHPRALHHSICMSLMFVFMQSKWEQLLLWPVYMCLRLSSLLLCLSARVNRDSASSSLKCLIMSPDGRLNI